MSRPKKQKRLRYKGRRLTVRFDVWNYSCEFLVGPFEEALDYARAKLEWPDLEMSPSWGVFVRKDGYEPIVWLHRTPRTPHDYGVLAHELMHLIRAITDFAGIVLARDTDEAFAHTMGYAMETVLKELRK